eukprot:2900577-Prymnesium_polylepis.1
MEKPDEMPDSAANDDAGAVLSGGAATGSPEKGLECVVCIDRPREVVFVHPSGMRHAVCCVECAMGLHAREMPCPLCHKPLGRFERSDAPILDTVVAAPPEGAALPDITPPRRHFNANARRTLTTIFFNMLMLVRPAIACWMLYLMLADQQSKYEAMGIK